MLKKYDGKIGFWEFFSIILFCLARKLTDTTPILLIDAGLNAAWMLPILSGLLMLLPFLCLLSLLKLYKNKNLIEIIYDVTGRKAGFIISALLLVIAFEYITITIRSYADILSALFYLKTPIVFLTFLLITSVYYIANKGIAVIGSLSWLLYPLIQTLGILLIPMIWKEMNTTYLFPLGGPGILPLLKEGAIHTTVIGDIIFLTIFFPMVRSYKEFKAASLLGLWLSIFQLSFYMIIYVSVYGYPTLTTLNYPHQQLTRLISLGRFANNVEALFLGFWSMGSLIRLAIYFYATAATTAATIRRKDPKPLLPFIALFIFFLSLLPENFTTYILILRVLEVRYFFIFLTGLPVLLWVIARWKGEFKKCGK